MSFKRTNDAYKSLSQVWFWGVDRVVFDIWAQLAGEVDLSTSNWTIENKGLIRFNYTLSQTTKPAFAADLNPAEPVIRSY